MKEEISIASFGDKLPKNYYYTKAKIGIKILGKEIITCEVHIKDYLANKLQVVQTKVGQILNGTGHVNNIRSTNATSIEIAVTHKIKDQPDENDDE
uniref:Alba domain-containing protein n=1 Tax=Loa loa TaxID=7209 RepID=A0A1I7VJM3_LOALO